MNEVLGIATMRLRRALEASMREDPEVQALLDEVVARRLDPASAASAVLARGAIDPGEAARADEARRARDHSSSSRCNTTRRSLQSRHAEDDRRVRLRRRARGGACPCPRGAAERAARGGRRRPPRHASTPTAPACGRCGRRRPPVRSPGSPGRRTATGSRSRTPAGSSVFDVAAGRGLSLTDGGRDVEPGLVGRRAADRVPARRRADVRGARPRAVTRAALFDVPLGATALAWAPNLTNFVVVVPPRC